MSHCKVAFGKLQMANTAVYMGSVRCHLQQTVTAACSEGEWQTRWQLDEEAMDTMRTATPYRQAHFSWGCLHVQSTTKLNSSNSPENTTWKYICAADTGPIEHISYQHTKFHMPNYRLVRTLFWNLCTTIIVSIIKKLLPKFWVRIMNNYSVVQTLKNAAMAAWLQWRNYLLQRI